jgi:MFS family permease
MYYRRHAVVAFLGLARATGDSYSLTTCRGDSMVTSRRALQLVLLVSLAHALVHTYEFLFPSVEQLLAAEWSLDAETTGLLAGCFALPFGLGAIGAGWLSDRVGARAVLIAYLTGASAACIGVSSAKNATALSAYLFLLGGFSSLYHPAGLAYISRLVPRAQLGPALGYHGILGSTGIAGTPILAATILLFGPSWNDLYLIVVPVGVVLAVLLAVVLPADAPTTRSSDSPRVDDARDWVGFALTCLVLAMFGMIYRGFTTFLPRFLDDVEWGFFEAVSDRSRRNYLTGGVLFLGILGQSVGGWLCFRFRLESLLLLTMALNVPFLVVMGTAEGWAKVGWAGSYSIVHFLMQPVGNSLIAHYTPHEHRSLGYGISFMLSFGLGSIGGWYAGWLTDRFGVWSIYPGLAVLASLAVAAGWLIRSRSRPPIG